MGLRVSTLDTSEQTDHRREFGDRTAARLAVVEMLLEAAAIRRVQRAHQVRRVPFGETRVIGVHRVTPFSCSASRRDRMP
ncbi:hypothetical protein HDC95_000247 [Microbacterium sp. AK031]|nr:hypothetical protein [Microbacterium sp. AK031]